MAWITILNCHFLANGIGASICTIITNGDQTYIVGAIGRVSMVWIGSITGVSITKIPHIIGDLCTTIRSRLIGKTYIALTYQKAKVRFHLTIATLYLKGI